MRESTLEYDQSWCDKYEVDVLEWGLNSVMCFIDFGYESDI